MIPVAIHQLASEWVQRLKEMLRDGSLNDVCIKLHDGEIKANKSVLAKRCEYFAAAFRWKENNNQEVVSFLPIPIFLVHLLHIRKYMGLNPQIRTKVKCHKTHIMLLIQLHQVPLHTTTRDNPNHL